MRTEHRYWHSPRLGHDMGVAVFGHWGPPLLAFPTSHGDEWELQRHGMTDALAEFIDGGRVKLFCVGSNNHESFLNSSAHPFHRSWRQRMFDEYIREEVFPFIYAACQTDSIPIATMGASLGAYHAANTLFRYPHRVKRCYALSGVYDLKRFMDGMYDDNFYFHNPVDYMANLDDSWIREQLASCEIRLATGSGPWEESRFCTRCLASSPARASTITWTIGGRAAATTGRTGRRRCGNICRAGRSGSGVRPGSDPSSGARLQLVARSNFSSRYCPCSITLSSSIQTSHSRVRTSTCVCDDQSARV